MRETINKSCVEAQEEIKRKSLHNNKQADELYMKQMGTIRKTLTAFEQVCYSIVGIDH